MMVVVLLGAPVPLCLMAWLWIASYDFAAVYADFGGALPWLTALALSRAWIPSVMLAYFVALPLPVLLVRNAVARDFLLLIVVIAALMLAMATGASFYLPLFVMSLHLN